jgi:hypothetical protein
MSIRSLYGSRCVLVLSSKRRHGQSDSDSDSDSDRGSAVTSAWWQCTFVHCKEFKNNLGFRVM